MQTHERRMTRTTTDANANEWASATAVAVATGVFKCIFALLVRTEDKVRYKQTNKQSFKTKESNAQNILSF